MDWSYYSSHVNGLMSNTSEENLWQKIYSGVQRIPISPQPCILQATQVLNVSPHSYSSIQHDPWFYYSVPTEFHAFGGVDPSSQNSSITDEIYSIKKFFDVNYPPLKRRRVENSLLSHNVPMYSQQDSNKEKETDVILSSQGLNFDTTSVVVEKEGIKLEDRARYSELDMQYSSAKSGSYYQLGLESEDSKRSGVSLTDFFNAQQIMEHLYSLNKCIDQSLVNGLIENTCQLCHMDKLVFTSQRCSSCGHCIKCNTTYYWTRNETGAHYCFCISCFRNSRGGKIFSRGLSFSKAELHKDKNTAGNEESWVQCDKCECWQHQICALYNAKKDLEGKGKYTCPFCRLAEMGTQEHVLIPSAFGAKDLPRTKLSDHIEQRLFKSLDREKNERAKLSGKSLAEVPGAKDLVVRVVLAVNKQLKVNQRFLDIFDGQHYPTEFPYESKVILLFQNIEGVDVCLFGIYVQEFGSQCGPPNQRCVYISYLDSVKYFRPDIRTVTGEALRTFVYHEILVGYLDYCKNRGFTTCYIWACPPAKGDDYLFYCHPNTQKTPKPDKLRHWYKLMIKKAVEENIVVDHANFYDHFFVPKCNAKITAARLPYFDGDYWSNAAEEMIQDIEKGCGGDSEKALKRLMTRRTLKSMGHSDFSPNATKDLMVMEKLRQSILPAKEDFIILYLRVSCTECHRAILTGRRWFCKQCKNFHLCDRCLEGKNPRKSKMHTALSGESHLLYQISVNDIRANTDDDNIILDNALFKDRCSFLRFCEENNYQFDTLRRAKHSSMMIVCHLHKMTTVRRLRARIKQEHEKHEALNEKDILYLLQHAHQCRATRDNPCSYPKCIYLKWLFRHSRDCETRLAGNCEKCKKTRYLLTLLSLHSDKCRDSHCLLPRCKDIKAFRAHVANDSSRVANC